MRRSPKAWKEQNVSSLENAIDQTRIADIDLFNTLPDYMSQCQEPPPWRESNINIGHLPISKKHAMLNQSAATLVISYYFRMAFLKLDVLALRTVYLEKT